MRQIVYRCHQDDELVTPLAEQRASGRQRTLKALRHRLQQLVAGTVAERVVDVLEAIKVDKQNRQTRLTPVSVGNRRPQGFCQQQMIGQSCQHVVLGKKLHRFLIAAPFADIGHRSDHLIGAATPVADGDTA